MSAPNPIRPVGRWRVTLEGDVERSEDALNRYVILRVPGGRPIALKPTEGTWERLPDPEPEWAPGDLVLDANNCVWRRFQPREVRGEVLVWSCSQDDAAISPDEFPARPLRRLIPEGDA